MPRRYYRRSRNDDGLTGILVFLSFIAVITLYSKVTVQTISLVIIVYLLCVGFVLALILFARHKRLHFEQQIIRALSVIDINRMDGLAFERYVAKLLKNQGYTKVALTEIYDLGIDIIAVKDGIRWGVQVKRYSNMVGAEAVRQVVTALNKYGCQRAMVVTNSTFSRPAKILAQTNNCVLIGRDKLAEWVISFQSQV